MTNHFTKPADFWQERDFGQKISATFEFVVAHWRPLGRVLLQLVVPGAILSSIGAVLVQTQLAAPMLPYGGNATRLLSMFQSPLYLLINVLNTAFYTLLVLSVYGYLRCCLYGDTPGAEVTPRQVWAVVKYKWVSAFFSFYGIGLLVGLAALLLLLPGVYLGVVLSLFYAVNLLEDTGFGATVSRCHHLISGKWWATFGLLACMLFIVYLVSISFSVVALLFGGVNGLLLRHSSQPGILLFIISTLVGLSHLLLYPPVLLALAFQYFNLVERQEGRGLRLLVEQLGAPLAAPTVESAHYRPDDEGEY